jgi:hypothetical protein
MDAAPTISIDAPQQVLLQVERFDYPKHQLLECVPKSSTHKSVPVIRKEQKRHNMSTSTPSDEIAAWFSTFKENAAAAK